MKGKEEKKGEVKERKEEGGAEVGRKEEGGGEGGCKVKRRVMLTTGKWCNRFSKISHHCKGG